VYAVAQGVGPAAGRERPALLAPFQDALVTQGVELRWPDSPERHS
jgi:hypothetical protein